MYPTSAFDQFLLLQDQRNKIVYDMALAGKKLKKAISDLARAKADLESTQKITQKCIAARDFLFYEAKVVLLSEWDRAVRIIQSNKALIPEIRDEMVFLEKEIRVLHRQITDMNKQVKEIERQMTQFGKVIKFNGNRQKASGD